MDRDKAKKILEKEMDDKLAKILLEFEAGMCKIWETDNHHKNHKLKLTCFYEIKGKNKIKLSTDISIL